MRKHGGWAHVNDGEDDGIDRRCELEHQGLWQILAPQHCLACLKFRPLTGLFLDA